MKPSFLSIATSSSPSLSLIIPTLNEGRTIKGLVSELLKRAPCPTEVIIVDDGSGDETINSLRDLADPNVKIIERPHSKGLASATLRGIIEARGSLIGWTDADAFMFPDHMADMVEALEENDIVLLSRYVGNGADRRGFPRKHASITINKFAGLMLNCSIKDYTSNLTIVRREVFNHVLFTPRGFGEFFIELVFKAEQEGLKIREIPYCLEDRQIDVSKAFPSWGRFLKLGLDYGSRILLIRFQSKGRRAVKGIDYS